MSTKGNQYVLTEKKTCDSSTLSVTNPMPTYLVSNLSFRGKMPQTVEAADTETV